VSLVFALVTNNLEAPAEEPMKICPFCAEEIRVAAIICRFCRSSLAPIAEPVGAVWSGAIRVPPQKPSAATDLAGAAAMVGGGYVFLAIALLYLLGTVVTSLVRVGQEDVSLYYLPYYFTHFAIDSWRFGFEWGAYDFKPTLCLFLSIAAAILLIGGRRMGAAVWRVHRRVPSQAVALVAAGLFLAGFAASYLMPKAATAQGSSTGPGSVASAGQGSGPAAKDMGCNDSWTLVKSNNGIKIFDCSAVSDSGHQTLWRFDDEGSKAAFMGVMNRAIRPKGHLVVGDLWAVIADSSESLRAAINAGGQDYDA
jgi:hypothetical protein